MLVTITGKLIRVDPSKDMPGGKRKVQRVIFQVSYNDARIKTDFFALFLYGDDIKAFWEQYNFKHPPHSGKFTAKLNGRLKNNHDNLTLTYKKIKWLYD